MCRSRKAILKCDEVFPNLLEDGIKPFKPRMVISVCSLLNTWMALSVDAIHGALKQDLIVLEAGGVNFSIAFCAGLDLKNLSIRFSNIVSKKGIGILVGGDDSLVIDTRGVNPVFVELDMTAFDASIGPHLLRQERELYREMMNLDANEIKLLGQLHELPIDFKLGNKAIGSYAFRINTINRSSGYPDTSLMNSVTNAACLFTVLADALHQRRDPLEALVQNLFNKFGLRAKELNRSIHSYDVSFLRGFFVPSAHVRGWTTSDFCWMPSLGRYVKYAKTFSCPTQLYPGVGFARASEFFNTDMFYSIKTFPHPDFLEDFYATLEYKRLDREPNARANPIHRYQVQAPSDGQYVVDTSVLTARYSSDVTFELGWTNGKLVTNMTAALIKTLLAKDYA